jgi:hypothetical protein
LRLAAPKKAELKSLTQKKAKLQSSIGDRGSPGTVACPEQTAGCNSVLARSRVFNCGQVVRPVSEVMYGGMVTRRIHGSMCKLIAGGPRGRLQCIAGGHGGRLQSHPQQAVRWLQASSLKVQMHECREVSALEFARQDDLAQSIFEDQQVSRKIDANGAMLHVCAYIE